MNWTSLNLTVWVGRNIANDTCVPTPGLFVLKPRLEGKVVVAGLAAFQRGKSGDASVKPSGWQTILKGAGMVSTLWLAFSSPGRDQKVK